MQFNSIQYLKKKIQIFILAEDIINMIISYTNLYYHIFFIIIKIMKGELSLIQHYGTN